MNGILLLGGKPKGGMGGRGSGMDMESEDMGSEKPGIMEAKALIVAIRSGNPEKVLTAFKDIASCCGDEGGEGESMDMESEEKEV